MSDQRGLFLTLEGGEGSGKSTNLQVIVDTLRSHDIHLIETREPGGTPLGEQIRHLLLHRHEFEVHADSELLLMFAARVQHINELIFPALERGEWVVSDRFIDATYAYQCGGRGINTKQVEMLQEQMMGSFLPDLTLYLDIEPQVGLERAAKRASLDRIEREQLSFFKKVRCCYLERAAAEPDRIKVIDASLPLEAVSAQVCEVVENFISRNSK